MALLSELLHAGCSSEEHAARATAAAETSAGGASAGGSSGGAASKPALPSLAQNLRRPLSALWAPLHVDSHNAPAVPTYALLPAASAPASPLRGIGGRVRAEPVVGGVRGSILVPTVLPHAGVSRWAPTVTGICEAAPMEPPFDLPLLTEVGLSSTMNLSQLTEVGCYHS